MIGEDIKRLRDQLTQQERKAETKAYLRGKMNAKALLKAKEEYEATVEISGGGGEGEGGAGGVTTVATVNAASNSCSCGASWLLQENSQLLCSRIKFMENNQCPGLETGSVGHMLDT